MTFFKKDNKLFYGYVVAGASFCIMTTAWGINRTFGVFLDPMLNEFEWTRASFSGVFAFFMLLMGVFSIIAGRMADRFGARPVLITCGVFLGCSYMLTSTVNSVWQFYVFYGVLSGLGLSGMLAPCVSLLARWFVKRRALMSGFLVAGPGLGNAIMPPVVSLIIAAVGWRQSYFILGVTVLVIVIASALLLKDPRDMGLSAYGANEPTSGTFDLQTNGFSFGEAMRSKQFWIMSLISFTDFFLVNAIVVHLVAHGLAMGLSATAAAGVLSFAAGMSILGRIFMGSLADRIGNRTVLRINYGASVFAFLFLLTASEPWMLYLFAIVYGFSLWATGAIMSPLAAELFGLRAHGEIFACTFVMAGAVGGAIGPVFIGYIFDVTQSYMMGFALCALISGIGLAGTFCLQSSAKNKSIFEKLLE